jgi:AraC-like DNA-binding protein
MTDASKTYVYVFDNYVAQFVDGIDAGAHKHGAYQLSMSLDGRRHRCGPTPDDTLPALGHLVAPNTTHCLNSASGQQVLFLIAPQSTIARRLGSRHLGDSGFGVLPVDLIDRDAIADLRPAIDEGWPAHRVGRSCDALLGTLSESPWANAADLHPAIRAAITLIHGELAHPVSADDLARRVGLSTSRLLHLFKEQMGTPLRPHIQWLRLSNAMVRIADRTSITDAAAGAGFADGPHLTRSMRHYLGLRPSDLIDHPDIAIELCLTSPDE